MFAITLLYTASIGVFDAATGSDYMFLVSKPPTWSLLSVLGPWPWYIASAAGVAVVLLMVLDLPFRVTATRVRLAARGQPLVEELLPIR